MIINNENQISELINKLLFGMYFDDFVFGMYFKLRFYLYSKKDENLPFTLELCLHGDWWFDTQEEWERKIAISEKIAPNKTDIDVRLQAFELVNLRWSEGAEVSLCSLENGFLKINFKNGRILTISCASIMGVSWTLAGNSYDFNDQESWLIWCEDEKYSVRKPTNLKEKEE